MWTNYNIDMGKFETGRVFVVYQDREHKFKKYDTLDGTMHKGRFGHAVACAGNLNLDGVTRTNSRYVMAYWERIPSWNVVRLIPYGLV